MPDPLPSEQQRRALQAQVTDAREALRIIADPGYARIQEQIVRIAQRLDRDLHNPQADPYVRDAVCKALYEIGPLVTLKAFFEQQKTTAEHALAALDQQHEQRETLLHRLTSFMR